MKNWRLKLGSLVSAICLAVFVNYFFTPTEFGTSVIQIIAQVELGNVPDNKSVIWPANRQVEITVQGPSLFLSRVALSPPGVRVVLPEGVNKTFVAKLTADNINLPATVRLLGIKPSELEFELDDIVEKKVPVIVPQIGILAPELKLEKVKIEPSEIELKGPSRELKTILNIETNPVDLSRIEKNLTTELELRTPGSSIRSDLKNIQVTVEVSDAIGEVSFSNVPVILDVQNDSVKALNPRVSQKGVAVLLRGSKKVLKDIRKEDLIVKALLSNDSQLGDSIELSMETINSVDSIVISPRKVGIIVDAPIVPTAASKATSKSKNAAETANNAVSKKR